MRTVIAILLLLGAAHAAPLTQPRVQAAFAQRVKYVQKPGVLAKHQMTGEEAIMKIDGPCFLVSTAAGIARARPGFLDGAFTENPDGSVSVRFFVKSRTSGKYEPMYERVTRDIPRWKNGHAFSVQSRDEAVEWPALLEKAYAKHKRGYSTFDDGGIPGDAMTLLTGKPSDYYVLADKSGDVIFERIRKALDKGRAVVTGTYTKSAFRNASSRERVQDAELRGAMRMLEDEDRPTYAGTGLFAAHAYTVWAVKEEGGRRYVQLRDPLGYKKAVAGAPSTERKSGIFWLPLEQFRVLYEDMHIGG